MKRVNISDCDFGNGIQTFSGFSLKLIKGDNLKLKKLAIASEPKRKHFYKIEIFGDEGPTDTWVVASLKEVKSILKTKVKCGQYAFYFKGDLNFVGAVEMTK